MSDADRAEARAKFLAHTAWAPAMVDPLPSDASFRRYFRLRSGEQQALLMDAPPDTENAKAFVDVANHLLGLGLSAPRVFESDLSQGFVIIEDFGNDTFTKLLGDGCEQQSLYELAVSVLAHLHKQPDAVKINSPPYDEEVLLREASLFPDWYLPALTGKPTEDDVRQAYVAAWQTTIQSMPVFEPTLVLRDYHIDNLMVLPDQSGPARCGLLDFQDALIGHPAYDLVSLLEDARRDVPDALAADMCARYLETCQGTDMSGFDDWYRLLGAQRHAKVAGIFVRLFARDSKPVYLKHLPRVMSMLARSLGHPCLGPVKTWFDEHLPDPAGQFPKI